jgi:indole-3-glycerol phosphate synthase
MGFLADLLPRVRAQIQDPTYLRDLTERPAGPAPSLRAAVQKARDGWALLAERKLESPGAGTPASPPPALDRFVEWVRAGGADGLSCLSTRPAFGGSPRDVAELVRATGLPVLFKDFIVDPIQLEAAHRAGASAVLLIARLETEGYLERPIRELADAAHARDLEVLLEVHRPEEWAVAAGARVDLFGVNLRDLDTLRFEPEVAESTFRAIRTDVPVLGLSGVSAPADAERYRRWGADGLLVGTGFIRASDPPAFLASLRVPRGA